MANTNFTAEQQKWISNYEKAISALESSWQFSLANQSAARETLKNTYWVGMNANWYFVINPTSSTTPTTTPKTTQTPTQNLSNNQSQRDTLQKWWDAYTYEQQQEKLLQNKNLASDLAKYWITNKTAPTTTWTTQTWLNYQDDSSDRMDQIVSNLNNYYDNPNTRYLFSNYDDYYNYFIKDKWRSQAQVNLLNSYFSDKNKYNQFDAYTPEQIANWYLNWQVWNDYISYLKSTNPEAYNQLQWLIQQNTYQIENQSTLESIARSAWFSWFESYASMMWYKDDNKNWIYDILETSMSDEEKEYRNQYTDLDAQYTELQLMKDKVLDDLTAAYPWVSKTTLMLMADDRTTDLNQKMNELTIKMKQVNWYIQTLQADRELQQKTAQAQLEAMSDLYWMYYKYTAEWMSELAQAEYAATNITLDQAQTDTQKQMALQNVLDWIYDRYWDIIQRSEAQVINDVMRVSREEWISISDALEKNFMTPLRNKPQYQAVANPAPDVQKIWDNVYWYWDPSTSSFKTINWTTAWPSSSDMTNNNRGWRQQVMSGYASQWTDLATSAQSIANGMEWAYTWSNTCWYYVNDYIKAVTWTQWTFWSEISSKKALCDDTWLKNAKVWDVIVFDWSNTPWMTEAQYEYWHVWFITWKNNDGSINISSVENWYVTNRTVKPWDNWYKAIYWTKHIQWNNVQKTPLDTPMRDTFDSMLSDTKLTQWQRDSVILWETIYNNLYNIASDWSLDHFIESSNFQNIMAKLSKKSFTSWDSWEWFLKAFQNAVEKEKITDQTNLKVIRVLSQMIEKKLRKESWAAISSSEWLSNFENYLPSAGESYNNKLFTMQQWETNVIIPALQAWWMTSSEYKWLFTSWSPYYTKDTAWWSVANASNTNIRSTWTSTSKWTWNLTWAWTTAWTNASSNYSTLFSKLWL